MHFIREYQIEHKCPRCNNIYILIIEEYQTLSGIEEVIYGTCNCIIGGHLNG